MPSLWKPIVLTNYKEANMPIVPVSEQKYSAYSQPSRKADGTGVSGKPQRREPPVPESKTQKRKNK